MIDGIFIYCLQQRILIHISIIVEHWIDCFYVLHDMQDMQARTQGEWMI